MHRPRDPLLRFLLGAVLCLPLSLAAWWWFAREPLAQGLGYAVSLASRWLWPEAVLGIGVEGDRGLIISLIQPLLDSPQLFMALLLPFNRATVILALFWGLTLATPGRGLFRRLLIGTCSLLPIIFAGLLLYVQFQLALYRTHLPILTEIPPSDFALALPDSPILYYLWGLGRQLAVLVLPVLAPLLAWLALHRSFLQKIIPDGFLRRGIAAAPRQSASAALSMESKE